MDGLTRIHLRRRQVHRLPPVRRLPRHLRRHPELLSGTTTALRLRSGLRDGPLLRPAAPSHHLPHPHCRTMLRHLPCSMPQGRLRQSCARLEEAGGQQAYLPAREGGHQYPLRPHTHSRCHLSARSRPPLLRYSRHRGSLHHPSPPQAPLKRRRDLDGRTSVQARLVAVGNAHVVHCKA